MSRIIRLPLPDRTPDTIAPMTAGQIRLLRPGELVTLGVWMFSYDGHGITEVFWGRVEHILTDDAGEPIHVHWEISPSSPNPLPESPTTYYDMFDTQPNARWYEGHLSATQIRLF